MPLARPGRVRRNQLVAPMLAAIALAWACQSTAFEYPPGDDSAGPRDTARFELHAADGRTVTADDFRGRYLLVFFGYTNCPDVCPTTMATTAAALRRLGPEAGKLQPLFISVDARRDTPEVLARYTRAFHPDILGLTGDAGEIRRAARSLGAMYRTMELEGRYLVDHTASLYLVGPEGELAETFPHGLSPEALARRLTEAMGRQGTAAAEQES